MRKPHDELPLSRRFTNSLIVGKKYRVRYKLDGQRIEREFVGTYMGWVKEGNGFRRMDFSLRPAAGTTPLAEGECTGCWPTDDEHKVPTRVRA